MTILKKRNKEDDQTHYVKRYHDDAQMVFQDCGDRDVLRQLTS